MLAFFEGFFLALAETTEDELDSGRWKKTVETSQGKLRLGLSLPDILSPPAPAAGVCRPFNPLRSAGMMEGIRDLLAGQDFESEEEMRAFLENEVMGKELPPPAITGPQDEARELAIEAMDTPGRRGVGLARRALIARGDDEAAEDLLSRYEEDITAAHHFNLAMATFRRSGDGQASRERLGDAVAANRHAPELLLGRLEVPHSIPDTYILGSADEAVLYFLEAEEAWDETPGALTVASTVEGAMGGDEAARDRVVTFIRGRSDGATMLLLRSRLPDGKETLHRVVRDLRKEGVLASTGSGAKTLYTVVDSILGRLIVNLR